MSEICKMITLSTAHVSEDSIRLLERDTRSGGYPKAGLVSYQKSDYGFFIYVPSDEEEWKETEQEIAREDLKAVAAYARNAGCEWLVLDCDGPKEDTLPLYEW